MNPDLVGKWSHSPALSFPQHAQTNTFPILNPSVTLPLCRFLVLPYTPILPPRLFPLPLPPGTKTNLKCPPFSTYYFMTHSLTTHCFSVCEYVPSRRPFYTRRKARPQDRGGLPGWSRSLAKVLPLLTQAQPTIPARISGESNYPGQNQRRFESLSRLRMGFWIFSFFGFFFLQGNWSLRIGPPPSSRVDFFSASSTFIPKLFLRLLWLFSRSASLFRQNSGFPQLFRFCSDLGNPGIDKL